MTVQEVAGGQRPTGDVEARRSAVGGSSAAIHVEALTDAAEPAYQEFLGADPRRLIYAGTAYRRFLAAVVAGQGGCLVARRGGTAATSSSDRIVGALPYFIRRHELGTVINCLPWYGSHGGPMTRPDDPHAEPVVSALVSALQDIAHGCDDLISCTIVGQLGDDAQRGALLRRLLRPRWIEPRIGQVTALPAPDPDLERRLLHDTYAAKTRNLVRKSSRQGFELRRGDDDDESWDFLIAAHEANMRAIGGRFKPRAHFLALRACIPPEQRALYVARIGGANAAALLLLRCHRTIEYFTPVIHHEYRSQQPLSHLIHHAMMDAARDGCQWWNWGGTWRTQQSLHHFKAGFGGRDVPYAYYVVAPERGLARIRQHRQALADAFPNYYVYPYDQLS